MYAFNRQEPVQNNSYHLVQVEVKLNWLNESKSFNPELFKKF
jgi:hypothetical protein